LVPEFKYLALKAAVGLPLNSHQFAIRHKPNLQGAQLRFFVQVLYQDVKRDVHLAPGASI
jgi:hypothetical protein